ncbi:hypothetical protein ATK36_1150 [Amycolatopsis sulphurea]|uniref:Uncharacterized protein n=1 Tax=Amycolatopsis sulphurea TaxID=76022 RepID=A0A2A9G2B1_9PSEU|nr:hypothetical protein ATK36_1150 [Amycolatopsis sulphurea]
MLLSGPVRTGPPKEGTRPGLASAQRVCTAAIGTNLRCVGAGVEPVTCAGYLTLSGVSARLNVVM